MINILVLGARGQVGVDVCELLGAHEYNVMAFGSAEMDVCDAEGLVNFVEQGDVDVIVNCSAYTAVDKAEEEPGKAQKVNADGPKNLALISSKFNIPVIHISTDYVFDGSKLDAYIESDITNPINVYGKSKLAGENYLVEGCEKYIILRTSWVFGLHGNNFVKSMVRLVREREFLAVIGDQLGQPTYAGDIAQAILVIIKNICSGGRRWGIYNFAGDDAVSWAEFSRIIAKAAGRDQQVTIKDISTEEYNAPAARPRNSRLSAEKFYSAYGMPFSNWRKALNLFL